jgi:cyclic beta-1,2-glucan synthetase
MTSAICPAGGLLVRTEAALQTMKGLERHRGHFFNWYDTRSLTPLAPHYISSVDSGNLAGHLLTLEPGLRALIDAPILNPRWLDGLDETWQIVEEAVAASPESERRGAWLPAALADVRQDAGLRAPVAAKQSERGTGLSRSADDPGRDHRA